MLNINGYGFHNKNLKKCFFKAITTKLIKNKPINCFKYISQEIVMHKTLYIVKKSN